MQTGARHPTASAVKAAGWPWLPRQRARSTDAPTDDRSPGVLVAQLLDGPLAGSTREVRAIEGRPPKTLDIDSGGRTMRYCLAKWEQSGHTAVYGFLYDV